MNLDCRSRHTSIPRKRRGKPTNQVQYETTLNIRGALLPRPGFTADAARGRELCQELRQQLLHDFGEEQKLKYFVCFQMKVALRKYQNPPLNLGEECQLKLLLLLFSMLVGFITVMFLSFGF